MWAVHSTIPISQLISWKWNAYKYGEKKKEFNIYTNPIGITMPRKYYPCSSMTWAKIFTQFLTLISWSCGLLVTSLIRHLPECSSFEMLKQRTLIFISTSHIIVVSGHFPHGTYLLLSQKPTLVMLTVHSAKFENHGGETKWARL